MRCVNHCILKLFNHASSARLREWGLKRRGERARATNARAAVYPGVMSEPVRVVWVGGKPVHLCKCLQVQRVPAGVQATRALCTACRRA